jgi:hypothetical protein
MSYDEGEFSNINKLGICIPKPGKDKQYLKNWRPITLLSVLYKIALGCSAERVRLYLNKIIDEDQRAFLKGRFIG